MKVDLGTATRRTLLAGALATSLQPPLPSLAFAGSEYVDALAGFALTVPAGLYAKQRGVRTKPDDTVWQAIDLPTGFVASVSLTEADTLLEGHPDLAEAAVCAYADPDLGERVCACLVLAEGAGAPSVEALGGWLEERGLARFKRPERIELFDTLPRNPLGKVVRNELAAAVAARGGPA